MILTLTRDVRLKDPNVPDDTEHMSNRPTYTVVTWTTHYRIIGGRIHRDAIARSRTGELRLVAYPERMSA
jgi:hypothetical protein